MIELCVNDELIEICKRIKLMNKTIEEWRELESSDMFQSNKFCGGFESDEGEFTFSFYNDKSDEYWFNLSLIDIDKVVNGKMQVIQLRKSNS